MLAEPCCSLLCGLWKSCSKGWIEDGRVKGSLGNGQSGSGFRDRGTGPGLCQGQVLSTKRKRQGGQKEEA